MRGVALAGFVASGVAACAVWPGARADSTPLPEPSALECTLDHTPEGAPPELARGDGGWFVLAEPDQVFVLLARQLPGDDVAQAVAVCRGTCWHAHPAAAPVLALSIAPIEEGPRCGTRSNERYVEAPPMLAQPESGR